MVAANGVTIKEMSHSLHVRHRILFSMILLTLNAGWIDMLCYLVLGQVFASFLTGNFLFIGLSLYQGNAPLFIRAIIAVLLNFAGAALVFFSLRRAPYRQKVERWRRTIASQLMIEWALLLLFATIWSTAGDLERQNDVQVLLLALASLGMGSQGAIVQVFRYPGVVANALTGTVLVLAERVGLGAAYPMERGKWELGSKVLLSLSLTYVLGAVAVSLSSVSPLTSFVPLIALTFLILILLAPLDRGRMDIAP